MAAVIAWLSANWVAVSAIIGGIIAFANKDKIMAKFGKGEQPAATIAADEPSSLVTLVESLLDRLKSLIDRLGDRGKVVRRTACLTMIAFLGDGVAELAEGPEKEEQKAALQTLAKYHAVPSLSVTPTVASGR